MALKLVQFLAVILTALALVPSGAHLFSLINKVGLAAEQYYIVQGIYRGWSLFAFVLIPAIFANLALAIAHRGHRQSFRMALVGFGCLAATLVIFFIWTYPANQATDNWTTIPANWATLRSQWEYSHAANAVLGFIALCAATLSVLTYRE
jgi:lipopolysaccharide export LptBFGC system permease protein LptF